MVVHGDLKGVMTYYLPLRGPVLIQILLQANVLVTLGGRACLADFGLASVNNTEAVRFAVLETTGHEDATPRYEAPELLYREDEGNIHRTTASDMYAFGCVCYEVRQCQLSIAESYFDQTYRSSLAKYHFSK